MSHVTHLALSELLGTPVIDSTGRRAGRVREVAVCPQYDTARVSDVLLSTAQGDRILPLAMLTFAEDDTFHSITAAAEWSAPDNSQNLLLLERDLLDQQIIDIHGRKVVRVNDINLMREEHNGHMGLVVSGVEVGARGAVRRLLKNVVPRSVIHAMVERLPARVIPWDFVDMIETDPARRVKLKIAHERLARLHPADIADILEELTPADREAVFETLDEQVAADALEEINPRMQVSIVQSLDSDRASDILEEMDPDAAADLLADLPEEHSQAILEGMRPADRKEVSGLLEFREDTAAGRMTTDFIAVSPHTTAEQAIDALRNFQGGIETVSSIYVVDPDKTLVGAIPLSILAVVPSDAQASALIANKPISCHLNAKEKEFAELFDKYNLITLPVVDDQGRLCGLITADDVISLLRSQM